MKCDLCQRDNPTQKLLCECCADAVRRLHRLAVSDKPKADNPLGNVSGRDDTFSAKVK
jgi:hypothetical protein